MELEVLSEKFSGLTPINDLLIGIDVSNILGIQKWELPVSPQMAGTVRGNFPSDIPKTDQERCQNLVKEIDVAIGMNKLFEITEKLEGSSMTCYIRSDGDFGVCSRNLSLAKSDESSVWWKVANELNIEERMKKIQESTNLSSFAIQGELVGPGIQGNIYKLNEHKFFVFDVYDIKEGVYLNSKERIDLIEKMGLNHVPLILNKNGVNLRSDLGCSDVWSILSFADGQSVLNLNTAREGVVFKCIDGGMTFKAISNKYLLKNGG